jgi:signal transduction histidine kinase
LEYTISFEKIGNVYFHNGYYDLAEPYFRTCASEYAKIKDGVGVVITKINMANINQMRGNFKNAINDMLWAEKYIDTIKYDYIKTAYYNSLSNLHKELKDYPNAIKYSKKAIGFAINDGSDAKYWITSYFGHIRLLQFNKQFDEADKYIKITENLLKKNKLKRFQVELNSDKVNQLMEYKKYEEAKKLIEESLVLAKKLNTPNKDLDVLKTNLALIENLKGNKQKSIEDLKALLLIAKKEGRMQDVRDYYKDIYSFYSAKNDHKNALENHELFVEYSDSLNGSDQQKMLKDAQVKYQTEKKEKQLLLQEAKAKKQNTTIIILALLAGFILLLSFVIYRNQKTKALQKQHEFDLQQAYFKIESQNQLQKQRLDISRDLHDNIGAQLTFITSSVENIQQGFTINDEKLESKLSSISDFTKETIVELRDTIWAMNNSEISFEELQSRVMNFIDKAKGVSNAKFSFTIDERLNNYALSSLQGMNVFRTIQEALNNALKHAGATQINVSANLDNDFALIKIQDDGKGFDTTSTDLGNGLINMKKRIVEIAGTFEVESQVNQGTTIIFQIPLTKTNV